MNELSFRRMIRLLEAEPSTSDEQAATTDGMLPARELAAMLPEVKNVQMFQEALLKVEQGQAAGLFISEIKELANAFISLVLMPAETKMQVIEKMMPIQEGQPS